jgi:hypothetical protein
MAELTGSPSACCTAEQRVSCCEPSDKHDCCGSESKSCGCDAGVELAHKPRVRLDGQKEGQ